MSAAAATLLASEGLARCCAAASGSHIAGVEDALESRLSAHERRAGFVPLQAAPAEVAGSSAIPGWEQAHNSARAEGGGGESNGGGMQAEDAQEGCEEAEYGLLLDAPDYEDDDDDCANAPGAPGAELGASEAWLARPAELWTPQEEHLVAAAAVVARLRLAVATRCGFSCSAGIAQNKLLSKLTSGLHKPAQQTLLPPAGVPLLLHSLPLSRLKGLGGALGCDVGARLSLTTVGQLAAVPLHHLHSVFGEAQAQVLAALARGQCDEPVKVRQLPASHSTGKSFRRPPLRSMEEARRWLKQLAEELWGRVDADTAAHRRAPRSLTVGVDGTQREGGGRSFSRSVPFRPGAVAMEADAAAVVARWATAAPRGWEIGALILTAGGFEPVAQGGRSIADMFRAHPGSAAPSPLGVPAEPPPRDGAAAATGRGGANGGEGSLMRLFGAAAERSAARMADPNGEKAAEETAQVGARQGAADGNATPEWWCKRCWKNVRVTEEEHADFHFALELQHSDRAQLSGAGDGGSLAKPAPKRGAGKKEPDKGAPHTKKKKRS